MKFQLKESRKSGLNSQESYIIVRDRISFLRILGKDPHYELMTATASEDNMRIKVCSDQIRLIESALQLAIELGIKPQVELDWKSREYVKICSFIIENNDQEILINQIPTRFFEIYDNYKDIKSRATEDMVSLYNNLAIDDSGEDVYLSDGVYLSSDGSLH